MKLHACSLLVQAHPTRKATLATLNLFSAAVRATLSLLSATVVLWHTGHIPFSAVSARAADVQALGDLEVNAGQDVRIASGVATSSEASSRVAKNASTFSSSTRSSSQTSKQSQALASNFGGKNVSITSGQSSTSTSSDTARGSQVLAANSINLQARGAGADSNLLVQGSSVQAGNSVTLLADNQVNLQAATNTGSQTSSNSSSSGSVGVGIGMTGGNAGVSITAAASQGQGQGSGADVFYTNTQVNAARSVVLRSAGDTRIQGATVSAEQVQAEVAGNLSIQSLQDASTYAESQSTSGFSASVPIGAGTPTASISAGNTNIASNYRSANTQSGIAAGDGGFAVNVAGNTHLQGGKIASNAQAIADNKNSLTTGTLTSSDLSNQASASATTSGYSLNTDMASSGKYGASKAALTNAMDNASASSSSAGQTKSVISAGSVTITDEAQQKQITGQDAATTVASLNRDTTAAHTSVQKQDVQGLRQTVEAERAIKVQIVQQALKFTDEVYRTTFIKSHKMYEILKDKNGNTLRDEQTGRPLLRELNDAEKLNLKTASDGKVHIAANGIFNDTQAAATYADQHNTTTGPQYLVHFPEANNGLSELLVAGYQKFLESDTLGLSNSTTQIKRVMGQYGTTGLQLDGHSRGAMTVGNALESQAAQSNAQGSLKATTINFYGPAYNAQKADALLGDLQDRLGMPADEQPVMFLQFQNHAADPVGGLIGGNPSTGGTLPEGSSVLREAIRAVTGQKNTAHNCYGPQAPETCSRFWQDSGSATAKSNAVQIRK